MPGAAQAHGAVQVRACTARALMLQLSVRPWSFLELEPCARCGAFPRRTSQAVAGSAVQGSLYGRVTGVCCAPVAKCCCGTSLPLAHLIPVDPGRSALPTRQRAQAGCVPRAGPVHVPLRLLRCALPQPRLGPASPVIFVLQYRQSPSWTPVLYDLCYAADGCSGTGSCGGAGRAPAPIVNPRQTKDGAGRCP